MVVECSGLGFNLKVSERFELRTRARGDLLRAGRTTRVKGAQSFIRPDPSSDNHHIRASFITLLLLLLLLLVPIAV